MLQDEYFIIERENNDNYPLFSWDESRARFGSAKPIVYKAPIKLRLGEPLPTQYEWVDFHKLPGPVVSKKIADVFESLGMYRVQIVPAIVRNPKDAQEEPRKYWYIHAWNKISCLDRTKSDVDIDETDGDIWSIKKLVLDEKILKKIKQSNRLFFKLEEKPSVLLIHQSLKEAILAVKPRGLQFFAASEWSTDIFFKREK